MPKLTKREVRFESPAHGPDHCAECAHFEPAALHRKGEGLGTCAIVTGVMEGGDWCDRFEAKGNQRGK